MENQDLKGRVVDLLRYRSERTQPRLDFENAPLPGPARLGVVRPFRVLTDREVAHRERMVHFMTMTRQKA